MQKITVGDARPDMIVAKDVYNNTGVMLVSSGTELDSAVVEKLLNVGIHEVFVSPVNKANSEAQSLESAFAEISKFEKLEEKNKPSALFYDPDLKLDDVIYDKTREQAEKYVKKTMLKVGNMGRIDLSKISAILDSIIEQLLSKRDMVLTLSKLRSIDDYTYEHSVNVCILSLITGIDMKLDKITLKQLGTGAILHDIGKVGIPEEIIKKPTRLTSDEFEQIKLHTDLGYNILINNNVQEEAALIALCHHEKYDGTGYNHNLKSDRINLLARITAVSDVYDAMSNDRVYKMGKKPDIVYKEMIDLSNKHFDEDILTNFINHISMYPTGTGIILNTNHKGIVIQQNKFLPQSPVIRIFKESTNESPAEHVDIDMAKTKYIYIKDTY